MEQASLIPSHLPCFDYFLSSHLPPQPLSPSSLGLAPNISLHQVAVMTEPEILEGVGGAHEIKVSFKGNSITVE